MSSTMKGHLAAVFTTIVWAMTYISTKVVLRYFSVMDVTFFRIIIAYVSLALFSLIPQKNTAPGNTARSGQDTLSGNTSSGISSFIRREIPFFCAGFFGITAYFLFQNIGMSYTTAANSSISVDECVEARFTGGIDATDAGGASSCSLSLDGNGNSAALKAGENEERAAPKPEFDYADLPEDAWSRD